jgi:hypothetical protein
MHSPAEGVKGVRFPSLAFLFLFYGNYFMFEPNCVIVLLAPEISLKSRPVQKRMHEIIKNNIVIALKNNGLDYAKVISRSGRVFFDTTDSVSAIEVLKNSFGLNLLFATQKIVCEELKFESILNNSLDCCKTKINGEFAVRAKSFNKKIDARKLERELGSEILDNISSTKVNLTKPNTQCNILIFDKEVFVYFEAVNGIKGMPVGTQGRVVLNITDAKKGEELAISLMKVGCLPVLIKNKVSSKIDLKKYNSYQDLKIVTLEESKTLFYKRKVGAFFCDFKNLKDKKEFDKLISVKSFAPNL